MLPDMRGDGAVMLDDRLAGAMPAERGRWPELPQRIGLFVFLAASAALAAAIGAERLGGLVPCALCLLERWPYRAAIALGLSAAVLPRRASRLVSVLAGLAMLAGAGLAAVHVGVERGFWASPLPECAAPVLSMGSVAERLASMPEYAAKPCDEATYLVPGLKLSMAEMNLLYALTVAGLVGAMLRR